MSLLRGLLDSISGSPEPLGRQRPVRLAAPDGATTSILRTFRSGVGTMNRVLLAKRAGHDARLVQLKICEDLRVTVRGAD